MSIVGTLDETKCSWPECGCRIDLGPDWMFCETTAVPIDRLDDGRFVWKQLNLFENEQQTTKAAKA